MKFLKDIWRKKIKIGSFFGSSPYELSKFMCGIGEAEIGIDFIYIEKYPFEPSSVYPSKKVQYFEIDEIHLKQYPPTIKIGNDLVFISREKVKLLEDFAKRNNIKMAERASNWGWITEPFLDTEFDEDQKERTNEILESNGISREELKEIREEVGKQMYKYNFDTMLWDWTNLGLNDVLSAMRPKLSKEEFQDFYWRAMEIEQRKLNDTSIRKK